MVDGKGAFQAVGGDMATGPEPADIVDQDVQPWVCIEHLSGEAAHLRLG